MKSKTKTVVINAARKVNVTNMAYVNALDIFEKIAATKCKYYDKSGSGPWIPCRHKDNKNCTMYNNCQAYTCPLLKTEEEMRPIGEA